MFLLELQRCRLHGTEASEVSVLRLRIETRGSKPEHAVISHGWQSEAASLCQPRPCGSAAAVLKKPWSTETICLPLVLFKQLIRRLHAESKLTPQSHEVRQRRGLARTQPCKIGRFQLAIANQWWLN